MTGLTGVLWIVLIVIFVYIYRRERSGASPAPIGDIGVDLDRLRALHSKVSSPQSTAAKEEENTQPTRRWRKIEIVAEEEEEESQATSMTTGSSDGGDIDAEHDTNEEGGEWEDEEGSTSSASSSSSTPAVRGVKMQFVVLNKGSKSVKKVDPILLARDAASLAVKNIVSLRSEPVEGEVDVVPTEWLNAYARWSSGGVTKITLRCDSRDDFDWIVETARAGSASVGIAPSQRAKATPSSKRSAPEAGESKSGDELAEEGDSTSKKSAVVGSMPLSIKEYHKDAAIVALGPYYADELALLTGHLKLLA